MKLHVLSNYEYFPQYKTGIERLLGKLLWNICKLIGFHNFIKLEKIFINILIDYKGKEVVNFYGSYGNKEILNKRYYEEFIYKDFEKSEFIIPKDYDKILSQLYGEYRKLPPLDKRVTHHRYKVYWKNEDIRQDKI